jgi:outer membrane receptor for ferrienterochelin and colicins
MRDILKKILLIFIIALSPVQVFAKNLPSDLTGLSLEDLMNVTVSTASKYEQKTTEAPSSITIITADEIKKYGHRTLAEILKSVRGLSISYDRNYTYAAIRGFARPGDYNTRILFLVDGHRINETVDDYAGIGTDFIIDVDLIDRVEIARGPSFTLYGNNAFLGTINVITKTGEMVKGAEISGAAGNNHTFNSRLTYGHEFKNGLNLMLSASRYDSHGNSRLYYKEFDDPVTNNGFAQSIDGDNNYSLFMKTSFHDFSLAGTYALREKIVPTAPWSTIFNNPGTKTKDERAYADLKYVHTFDNQVRATARISYDRYYSHGNYIYDYPPITINKDFILGKWAGAEVYLLKKLFEKHTVIAGFEYTRSMHEDQRNYDEYPYAEYLNDARDSVKWAVYAQDEFSLLQNVTLNFGVRHDHFSTCGNTTNPRIALIYKPFDATVLKLLYGTAFRAPNAYELYYNDGPMTMKPNPYLKPEINKDYEIILEQSLGEHFNATALGFYYTASRLITQTIDPDDSLQVFKNADEVEVKGIEVEVEGNWSNGLKGRISYSHTKTQDIITGASLINAPANLVKLNVILPLIREKLFLGIEEQYTDKRKTLADNLSGSYMTTNATLFSDNLYNGLELSCSIYNLFNKRYSDPGAAEHLQDTIEQDGRTFRLKLVYSF